MSGPRRRTFVGPIVSRVTLRGGRGTPYLRRWALIIALAASWPDQGDAMVGECQGDAGAGRERASTTGLVTKRSPISVAIEYSIREPR